jgi:predicted metal-dependent phosphoesterase TrpH
VTDGVTVRIDPHVHSEGSYDSSEPVEVILEQAAEVGLDAVAITDHDTIAESRRAADLAADYGLVGIPGVEVSTERGHLLALGIDELPPVGDSLGSTVETIRESGGAAVVPHPFQRSRHGIRKRHLSDCDALEVYNAWLFTGYRNRRARRFAARHDYPGVAGSDAHSANWVGRAYTEVEIDGVGSIQQVEADDIVHALRQEPADIHGRHAPIHRSAYHYSKCAVRKTGYAARQGAAVALSLF